MYLISMRNENNNLKGTKMANVWILEFSCCKGEIQVFSSKKKAIRILEDSIDSDVKVYVQKNAVTASNNNDEIAWITKEYVR